MEKQITLIGAGLTGPLLAVYLARRGFTVDLYERRADMRSASVERGRSINLALSTRGIHALESIGIADEVLVDAIPMYGRMIHELSGAQTLQPYGMEGQAINSVSRTGLNIELMNAAERVGGVTIHFNSLCTDVDLENRRIEVQDGGSGGSRWIDVRVLIATDGANSALRAALERNVDTFTSEVEWLDHGYKELSIPAGRDETHRLEKHALHIWPRHDFMMIALPNPDGSFTNTLFLSREGVTSFASVKADEAIGDFFARHFPDAVSLMPALLEDWHRNPSSSLATVRCGPWHYEDWALLLGDAAHAIVPFYGQGMNACFEDVFLFDQLLAESGDWGRLLEDFYRKRKPDADSIAELALENFVEMRSKVVDPKFIQKRRLDAALHELFPDRWVPLYSMVTFSTIPYSEAAERARQQDKLLEEIGCDLVENALELGPGRVEEVLFME